MDQLGSVSQVLMLVVTIGAAAFGLMELRHRNRLLAEELRIKDLQYQAVRKERELQDEIRKEEVQRLAVTGSALGSHVAEALRKNADWACDALQKAKLGPYAETLFGERLEHFSNEKRYIAEHFAPLLWDRCEQLANKSSRVYIAIDSGTTLYPIFEQLGRIAAQHGDDQWRQKIVLVTNNLPGVEAFMEFGRINRESRFSELAIPCELLPGRALPTYSAVIGAETEDALDSLQMRARSEGSVIISLLTGNWVRMRNTTPVCPIPMARGGRHLEFKQKLVEIANETYVIAPLGKVFINKKLQDINLGMTLLQNTNNPRKEWYQEVAINDIAKPGISRRVKLVSTSRSAGYVLKSHCDKLRGQVDPWETDSDLENFSTCPIEEIPHLLFHFWDLPSNWWEQEAVEFPHGQREAFKKNFFSLPDQRG